MSNTSDNCASDASDSYYSEGEIPVSYGCESLSSSNYPDEDIKDDVPQCPVQELDARKCEEIISAMNSESDDRIFPHHVVPYVKERYEVIYQILLSLISSEKGLLVYIGLSLASVLKIPTNTDSLVSKTGIFDACIFSKSRPVKIISFLLDTDERRAQIYNTALARHIMVSVNKDLSSNISFIHGVIDKDVWNSPAKFEEKIKKFESFAYSVDIPSTLYMTSSKCNDILKSFLKLLLPTTQSDVFTEDSHLLDSSVVEMRKRKSSTETHEKVSQRRAASTGDQVTTSSRKPYKHPRSYPETQKDLLGNMLHKACKDGRLEFVKMTLSNPLADLNSTDKHGRTPVMVAALSGNKKEFDLLVENNCELSTTDNRNNTVLHLACRGGNLDIVNYLMREKKYEPEVKNERGQTAMAIAAEEGQTPVFHILLDYGSSVTSVDKDGNSILHSACESNAKDIVSCLLSTRSVDVNRRGKNGTPLMIAVRNGNLEILELLLESQWDAPADLEDTVVHVACRCNQIKVVEYLISKEGFGVNGRGTDGKTPLQITAETNNKAIFDRLVEAGAEEDDDNILLHAACLGGSKEMVKDILERFKIDINSTGDCGRTALMTAAANGWRDLCLFFINSGCDVSATDIKMNNALHFASLSGDTNTVDCILSQTALHIDSKGEHGRTAVMMTAEKGYREVFDLLVNRGCNVTLQDDNGYTILHVACIGNRLDFVKHLILQNHVDINTNDGTLQTPAMVSAKFGHRRVFELLVQYGCKVTDQDVDEDGNNILHGACLGGSLEIVDYLVSQNIVDINSKGQYGSTPILMAASRGHRGVFDLLVVKGASVKAVDDKKNTLLHLSCIGGHTHFVKYLLSKNIEIDIDSRGNFDTTPVMLAAKKGHRKIVEMLVEKGCNLHLVDQDGNNALHWACIAGKLSVVEYLLSQGKVDKMDMNGRNKSGATPAELSYKYNRESVYKLLMDHGCDVSLCKVVPKPPPKPFAAVAVMTTPEFSTIL